VPPLVEVSPGHLVACHLYPATDAVGVIGTSPAPIHER
jgi:hypothetical protein